MIVFLDYFLEFHKPSMPVRQKPMNELHLLILLQKIYNDKLYS